MFQQTREKYINTKAGIDLSGKRSRLKQKFVLSYASQLIIQLLSIIAAIVIARIAGPNVMGKITFGLSYANMFGFLTQLGLGAAHIKLISEGQPLDKCLGTYIHLIRYTTFIYIAFTISFFLIQKYGFKVSFEGYQSEYCIFTSIIVTVITSAIAVTQTTFAANLQQAKQDLPNILVSVISAIAKIIIVLLGFRVLMLATWNVVHTLLLLAISLFLMRKQVIGDFDRELAAKYIAISAPLLFVGMANSLMLNLDKVLLKFFASATEVGYYGAGYRIGGFIQLVATNIGALFFPLFSMYLAKGQIDELKQKIRQYQRLSLLGILPFVFFIVIFSASIVHLLLGKLYGPSIVPMAIITFALYIYTCIMPYGNLLIASGRYKRAAVNQIVVFVIFIVSLIVTVHPSMLNLKSTGAALSLLLLYSSSYIMNRFSVKDIIKIDVNFDNIRILAVMLVVVLLTAIGYRFIRGHMVYEILSGGMFFITIYGVLWITGLVKKADISFITQAMSPQQMKNYIKTELTSQD
jgi:O-antigen/teichoic acid export membrane protein